MIYSRGQKVDILSSFFKVHRVHINRIIRSQEINIDEFFEFLEQSKKIDRDKFYSFFKNEKVANLYWNRCFEDADVEEDLSICLDWE